MVEEEEEKEGRRNDGNKAFKEEKNEKLNLSVKTIVVGLRTKLCKSDFRSSPRKRFFENDSRKILVTQTVRQ